jgi:hypothetical protein
MTWQVLHLGACSALDEYVSCITLLLPKVTNRITPTAKVLNVSAHRPAYCIEMLLLGAVTMNEPDPPRSSP